MSKTNPQLPPNPQRESEACTQTKCTFRLEGFQAASVALLGSFNGWSTTQNLMKLSDGKWEAQLSLPPGKHEYCFFTLERSDALRGTLIRMGSTINVGDTDLPVAAGRTAQMFDLLT